MGTRLLWLTQWFSWWEIDLTCYALRSRSSCGLIRDLRPVPEPVLAEGRRPEGVTP